MTPVTQPPVGATTNETLPCETFEWTSAGIDELANGDSAQFGNPSVRDVLDQAALDKLTDPLVSYQSGYIGCKSLWQQMGGSGIKCTGQSFRTSSVGDQQACQDEAAAKGFEYYQWHPNRQKGMPNCAVSPDCKEIVDDVGSEWAIFFKGLDSMMTFWPQMGSAGRKCTGKSRHISTVKSRAECQLAAEEDGFPFYQYMPGKGRCAAVNRCSNPTSDADYTIYNTR